jgi:carbon-monoxide dehydrogenase large subunit
MTATFEVPTFGAGSFVGKAVRRVEDPDILAGRATYVGNLEAEGLLEAAFVRSPIAHATITSIDTSAAEAMPGVIAVYTAATLEMAPYVLVMQMNPHVVRMALAKDGVKFVGDPVALVVAETKAQAIDATEAVVVDYEPLPVVVDMDEAMSPDAPVLYEAVGSNVITGIRAEDGASVLDDADVVVRGRFENQRLAIVPMETNAIAVFPQDDGNGHQLTVHLATQMPHMSRLFICGALGIAPETVRVIAPHVGGSFGAKVWCAEEYVVLHAARALGRPVRWTEQRSENLTAMAQGRAQVQYVEMGFTRDGKITGMHCRVIGDSGGYGAFGGSLAMGSTKNMAQGVYEIPKIAFDVAVVVTNTAPTGPYRGAGRPEASAFLERIMDIAADELDIDPVELRRRNLIRPDQFPYTTRTGQTYDSGEYEAALDEALRLADYDGLLAEQAARRARGDRKLLGIGIAVYVEVTAGAGPFGTEFGEVTVHEDGSATIKAGTSAHGQGHATTFSQLVAGRLGIPIEKITYIQSDTALVPRGFGTGGSRSVQIGGSAVYRAAEGVLDRARQIAAELLEASPEDLVVSEDGRIGVAGVPATALSWAEIATKAVESGEPLSVQHDFATENATYPFGAHVCVVEIDRDTGEVEVVRHVAVDDCGTIINPLLVDGQVHGGLASGIAQALWERVVYDADGNPLTSTLAEYGIPSAAELPSFVVGHTETPSPLNPLGAKGIGESATVGSVPAVQNAVVDALSHLGIRHLDMPCTPERIWHAIRDAEAGRVASAWREPPAAFADLPVPAADAPHAPEINL